AGCKVTNIKGKPWTMNDFEIVAANPRLHKKLMQLVENV
ncbi:inositol monophosphatase, partial [Candidatus Kaiserbacteria bacterium]|nr:inositol monophosphatase [Candidatus Kaiserbacteria bacterium]